MYMGQPPVYSPGPGSMAPADLQSYQNTANVPVGLTQGQASYSGPAGHNLPPPLADNHQNPYPEKTLL